MDEFIRKAKILKKVMIGFSTVALVLSISIPAFADSLTLGWMTTGSYTGYHIYLGQQLVVCGER